MSKPYHPVLVVILLTMLMVGCREEADSDWQVVHEDRMTPGQTAQRDQALAARDAMSESLKGRLMEVVGSEGLAAAVEVCSEEAPEIARRVSEEYGLAIGRTSFRLRNPENSPPEWAAQWVRDRVSEATYVSNSGRLGALLPIRLQPGCLMCHGPKEGIPTTVAEVLAEHYPQDKATEFRSGELRGWFWVNVPADAGS